MLTHTQDLVIRPILAQPLQAAGLMHCHCPKHYTYLLGGTCNTCASMLSDCARQMTFVACLVCESCAVGAGRQGVLLC